MLGYHMAAKIGNKYHEKFLLFTGYLNFLKAYFIANSSMCTNTE